ncbi:MAG: hypothetical protein AAB198_00920 [Actinomycetota bacterium]
MLRPELIASFEFDVDNLKHLTGKHGIESEDVLEVFSNGPVFIEDDVGQTGDWYMVAPVAGGWRTIVLTESRSRDRTVARPITGWPSNRWEIERYGAES